ncbi:transport and Golgi organization protein 2 homolog [Acanthaster planci]|uniref:Transport and Golgi organization protein 2 homolog n=1 Tax=Acanthaster planci TaxID=133434 RepID=A0A8B7Z8V4_ACAPL|nr:transport and Golgi organization protein 2 homolog [Acanthaster planci]XP_022102093.1 transport and Golgi organization protein 2 homolog [Acanthaster planci]XP_022102094.1 transport and Golgi organization protein 2 homolog [Acanthaster planci]XP_022102095.1 transport and Golgi organization protein 2 homolog [Acanthaster planci]
MCLTVLMLNPKPEKDGYRLVLAFNRDEFYERPTKASEFWDRNPDIISGQDMTAGKEGGTWLGMSRSGRIAMLLNIIQPHGIDPDAKGRGSLVSDFLQGSLDGQTYLQGIAKERDLYNGFNLITVELGKSGGIDANYFTNYTPERMDPIKLKPGIHAFSNHTIRTSWLKTDYVKTEFEKIIPRSSLDRGKLTEELLMMMSRDVPLVSSSDISKEDMDIPKFRELLRELVFIKSNTYGTRTTTVILVDAAGNVSFTERTLKEPINPDHLEWEQRTHTFCLQDTWQTNL